MKPSEKPVRLLPGLIESDWNLKTEAYLVNANLLLGLIESDWNLKLLTRRSRV